MDDSHSHRHPIDVDLSWGARERCATDLEGASGPADRPRERHAPGRLAEGADGAGLCPRPHGIHREPPPGPRPPTVWPRGREHGRDSFDVGRGWMGSIAAAPNRICTQYVEVLFDIGPVVAQGALRRSIVAPHCLAWGALALVGGSGSSWREIASGGADTRRCLCSGSCGVIKCAGRRAARFMYQAAEDADAGLKYGFPDA